jgi:hypothetical protein
MEAKQLGVIDMEGFKKMEFLVRISKYDFRQFKTYKEIMDKNVTVRHLSTFDIDEVRNKMVIGIYDMTEKPQILIDCAKAGIPSDAVEVEYRELMRFYGG